MKTFYLLFISILIISCQEKTFADDITLVYPKNTKMKIQEFNEDLDEFGTEIIYFGKHNKKIEVKYYENCCTPPIELNETEKNYSHLLPYFRKQNLKQGETHYKEMSQDLNSRNLEIIVKEKDTIPLYKNNGFENKLKKYKAFPVFIKNISSKTLKIPVTTIFSFLFFKNENNKWQSVRNSRYMIEGYGNENHPFFEIKPNEILVYAIPYFKKGKTHKAKVKFYDASSKEFDISIDYKIIENQRNRYIMDY